MKEASLEFLLLNQKNRRNSKEYKSFIRTLHIHTGSDIKDPEVFVKGIEVLFELIPHFPELEIIDLGGGFKVPYHADEKETDIDLLAQK